MADFVAKLRDLEEKIVDEFNTPNLSLDNYLLFKIKYQINQIRQSQSHNIDTLIKSQMLMILKDLKQKIICEFHTYYNNNGQIGHVNTILFNIKYHIDEMENDILLSEKDDDSNSFRNIETKKATAIRRMHTLVNLITCRIINLSNDL